jgi:DNA-nicking Smr family endonuclease
MLLCDRHGGVCALAIDHDDFIDQAVHGLQARVQVVRFIARDDDGRESCVCVVHGCR